MEPSRGWVQLNASPRKSSLSRWPEVRLSWVEPLVQSAAQIVLQSVSCVTRITANTRDIWHQLTGQMTLAAHGNVSGS
jgi:hypothetical protein